MIEGLLALALATALPLGVRHAVAGLAGERAALRARPVGLVMAIVIALAILALALPRGPVPAALSVPWLAFVVGVGGWALGHSVRHATPHQADRPSAMDSSALGILASLGFLAIGAGWLVLDRAGAEPLGFGPTIVQLTAVHFHVAGFVLTLAGSLAVGAPPRPGIRLAILALVLGIPATALGFLGVPGASLAGALLVGGAGIVIGITLIAIARGGVAGNGGTRLLGLGGATLLLTMPLAAGYAIGSAFRIPFLDVPAMAATHGTLNVVGFAIPTMIGWRTAR